MKEYFPEVPYQRKKGGFWDKFYDYAMEPLGAEPLVIISVLSMFGTLIFLPFTAPSYLFTSVLAIYFPNVGLVLSVGLILWFICLVLWPVSFALLFLEVTLRTKKK